AAASRERIVRTRALVEAAGLKTLGITSTTLQLASAIEGRALSGFLLAVLPEYAEIAVLSEGNPVALRHIPLAAEKPAAERARDFSLALAQASAAVQSTGALRAASFAAWEAAAHPRSPEALGRDFSVKVDAAVGLDDIAPGKAYAGAHSGDNRFAGAAALALAVAARRKLPMDFAAPRLEKRKRPMRFRPLAWAAAVALAFAVASAMFLLDWRS
ncbi:unnamed protein product, partial [marine sediment metagenome]